MLTILQMYLVQAILYACDILEAPEFPLQDVFAQAGLGILLEVAAGTWNLSFKNPCFGRETGHVRPNL